METFINVPTIPNRKRIPQAAIQGVVVQIAALFQPQKIILFGSYANGVPNASSDIDLMVITDSKKPSLELGAEIAAYITHTLPVDIIVKTAKELEKRLKMGDFL